MTTFEKLKPSDRVKEIVLEKVKSAFSSLGPGARGVYEDQALKDPEFMLPAILQYLDEVHGSSALEEKVLLDPEPLPEHWNGSPKGCWDQHPRTREICQLPPDGHIIHKRDDAGRTQLMRWKSGK